MRINIFRTLLPLVALSLIILVAVAPQKAAAAAQCYVPLPGGSGTQVGPCYNNGKPLFPVQGGGGIDPNSCYTVGGTSANPLLVEADCTKPPFDENYATSPGISDGSTSALNRGCSNREKGESCILQYITDAATFLTIGVGIIVTIMIVIGGIQYSTAGGDPAKVAGAKQRIFNAVFALLVFAFLWSFLQWITPGGIFK